MAPIAIAAATPVATEMVGLTATEQTKRMNPIKIMRVVKKAETHRRRHRFAAAFEAASCGKAVAAVEHLLKRVSTVVVIVFVAVFAVFNIISWYYHHYG